MILAFVTLQHYSEETKWGRGKKNETIMGLNHTLLSNHVFPVKISSLTHCVDVRHLQGLASKSNGPHLLSQLLALVMEIWMMGEKMTDNYISSLIN